MCVLLAFANIPIWCYLHKRAFQKEQSDFKLKYDWSLIKINLTSLNKNGKTHTSNQETVLIPFLSKNGASFQNEILPFLPALTILNCFRK